MNATTPLPYSCVYTLSTDLEL